MNFNVFLSVLGDIGAIDDPSESLSAKISQKLQKPVYVAYNYPEVPGSYPEIMKRVFAELKTLGAF